MKLLLAVSGDGFLAKGPDDDMKWTGPEDKAVFKLLTQTSNKPLLAGSTTHKLLPDLKGRVVFPISRSYLTLDAAAVAYKDSWLIGGQTVALAALEKGYLDEVVLCMNNAKLGEGVQCHTKIFNFGRIVDMINFPSVAVQILRK